MPGPAEAAGRGSARRSPRVHLEFTRREHSRSVTVQASQADLQVHVDDLGGVARWLHEEYDDRVGAAAVDRCVAEVAGSFAHATVHSFVPLLVRRYVREALEALLQERTDRTVDVPRIVPD